MKESRMYRVLINGKQKAMLELSNVDGYIFQEKPARVFFASTLIEKSVEYDTAFFTSWVSQNGNDIKKAINDPIVSKFLVRFDTEGYEFIDIEKEKEETAEKLTKVNVGNGFFGYTIIERLPKNLWAKIKRYAEYHRGDDNEMEDLDDMGFLNISKRDVQGWYYTREALEVLMQNGIEVYFRDTKISSVDDIQKINHEYYEAQKKIEEEHKKRIEFEDSLENELHSLVKNAEIPRSDEISQNLNHIKIGKHRGADIYGGGSWFALDDDYLYYIRNNGHDGDDWSRNNYGTGGAGAICYRIKRDEQVNSWLEKYEDYYKTPFSYERATRLKLNKLTDRVKTALTKAEIKVENFTLLNKSNYDKNFFFVSYKNLFVGYNSKDICILVNSEREFGIPVWGRNIDNDFTIGFETEATEELIAIWKSQVPDWCYKNQYGRFTAKAHSFLIKHTSYQAIRPDLSLNCYKHISDVKPIAQGSNKLIWSDAAITEKVSKYEADIYDEAISKLFGIEPLPALEIKKLTNINDKLLSYRRHGISNETIFKIEELNVTTLKDVEIGNGGASLNRIKTNIGDFYSAEAVFVYPPDGVDEYNDLYDNYEDAEQKYNEYLKY